MPQRIAFVVGALLLVLTGCASHEASGDVRLVPWNDAVPTRLQPPTGTPAPLCQASGLKVVGTGFHFAPALAGGTGQVMLRNGGSVPCRLTGRPDVQIVGAVPAPAQQQMMLPTQPPAFPAVAPPDSLLAALPPGAAVTLDVDWRNWCVPQTSATPVPPQAIRMTLPDAAGAIDVGYDAVPPCDTPGTASTVGVRPFQPAPLDMTTPWTSTVVQATIQPSSGGTGKLSGKRGETVSFVVELHNPSSAPISFERCPLVIEMLAPAGHPEVHQLNCTAAAELPASGSLRFEMRIRVPVDAPAGNNGLFWELDPTGAQGPEAVSGLVVADH